MSDVQDFDDIAVARPMSEIERLRALLATLTEGCAPGPWHGVTSGNPAAYSWWLDNPAGDSSFPTPEDVAAMLNALPALLDVVQAAEKVVRKPGANPFADDWERLTRALARLDGAS